ncbi:Rdx family protein [candidate division KSB1 bacterium]|nr:Rdx family protein [candidate division KSB1 bacterium]
MADEIFETFGVKPTLVVGTSGIFDVIVNGEMIFSKFETYRFPQPGEILTMLVNLK